MNEELNEYLEKLTTVRDGLDEKIREARGLMKDFDKLNRELAEIINEKAPNIVDELLGKIIEVRMNELSDHINAIMATGEKRINQRFDNIANSFLGKKKDQEYSMEVLLLSKAMLDNLIDKASKDQNTIVFKKGSLPPGLQVKKPRLSKSDKIRGEIPPWVV